MSMINKIICGDCIDIIKRIPDEKIDLVVTSPPYDEIRDYNGFKLNLHSIGIELFRVIKDGGVVCIVINDGTKNFRKSGTSFRLAVDWMDIGFGLFETVIYSRDGRPGAWWSKRFRVDHEYIFIFFKGDRPNHFDKSHLSIPAKYPGEMWHGTDRLTNGSLVSVEKKPQKDTKCRGTIWKYSSSKIEHNKLKSLHPAPFPDKLAYDLILCFSQENDIVLDPMCGSGTTCVMSKTNNRRFIGIDISKEYCDLAKKRIEA